jgi:surface antigen
MTGMKRYFFISLPIVAFVSVASLVMVLNSRDADNNSTPAEPSASVSELQSVSEPESSIQNRDTPVAEPEPTQQSQPVATQKPVEQPAPEEVKNPYEVGFAHWHAFNRRTAVGKPVGTNWMNGAQWVYYAKNDGYKVDSSPEIYSMVTKNNLLGFVEGINSDGSVIFSAMNYKSGWSRIDTETIPSSEVANYTFIH